MQRYICHMVWCDVIYIGKWRIYVGVLGEVCGWRWLSFYVWHGLVRLVCCHAEWLCGRCPQLQLWGYARGSMGREAVLSFFFVEVGWNWRKLLEKVEETWEGERARWKLTWRTELPLRKHSGWGCVSYLGISRYVVGFETWDVRREMWDVGCGMWWGEIVVLLCMLVYVDVNDSKCWVITG